jgi:hypothetical protein
MNDNNKLMNKKEVERYLQENNTKGIFRNVFNKILNNTIWTSGTILEQSIAKHLIYDDEEN